MSGTRRNPRPRIGLAFCAVLLVSGCGDSEADEPREETSDGPTPNEDPEPAGAEDDVEGATETNAVCAVPCDDDADCESGNCERLDGVRCCTGGLPSDPDTDGGAPMTCNQEDGCPQGYECRFPGGDEHVGECVLH